MPDLTDDDIERIRTEAAAAATAAAEAKATEAAAAAQAQRDEEWQQHLRSVQDQSRNELAEALNTLASGAGAGDAMSANDIDDDTILTGRDYKAREAKLRKELEQQNSQTTNAANTVILRNQRASNRQFALNNPELKYIKNYIKEVDAFLDKADPFTAADSRAYTEMYRYVCSLHQDEINEAEYKERRAREAAEADSNTDFDTDTDTDSDSDLDFDLDSDTPKPTPTAATATRRPQQAPAAQATTGTNSRTASGSRPNTRRVRLTSDERFVVERYFDGNVKAYLAERDGGPDRDVLGLGKKTFLAY